MKQILLILLLFLHFSVSAQVFVETESVKIDTFPNVDEIVVSSKCFTDSNFLKDNYLDKYYGIGIYASQGIALGNYAQNFTSPFSLGFTGRLGINRWIALANFGLNFGLTKQKLSFENSNNWSKRAFLMGIDLDVNTGYKVFQNLYLFRNYDHNISLFPLVGIGFSWFTPFMGGGNKLNDYVAFIPYYKLGLNTSYFLDDQQHISLELGVKLPLIKHKYYEYFDGIMPYIKISFEFEELFEK